MKSILMITSFMLAILFIGCAKPKPPVVEPKPEPKPAPVVAPAPVDTTDNAVFDTTGQEAAFLQKVKDNMLTLYFDYNQATLTPESIEKLATAARFMKVESTIRIRLDGHADERGTSEYNMALGEKRAKSVEAYLEKSGVSSSRLEVTSFGRENPAQICTEGDESCYAKNRRVEYTLIGR